MKASEFKLGLRVRRRGGESSFIPDRRDNPRLGRRRVGIVVGLPEALSTVHRAARIQWEGSSLTELVHVHRLEQLPLDEQPVALGGKWVADDTTFLTPRPRP